MRYYFRTVKQKNLNNMNVRKNIAISDEGFLFNPSTGDSFSTNPIGAELINLLKKNVTTEEIVEIICQKYDVDRLLFERDLEDFTIQLKDFNILES